MQEHTGASRQKAGLLPGVLVAALLVAAAVPASAKDYTVGDSSGWAPGVDYNAWAKGKTLYIGDTLLFQYNGAHTVAEVSAADHSSCSASNPLRSYKDGTTIITLTKPGTRYFICGTTGHCTSGMKLAVTVASPSDDAAAAAAGHAGTTTTTRTTSDTSGGAGSCCARSATTWLPFLAAASLALVG
ncbi:hypothetical protein ABZP36_007265 [Zizania latifolia]